LVFELWVTIFLSAKKSETLKRNEEESVLGVKGGRRDTSFFLFVVKGE
jgi:hypothetical protein